MATDAERFRTRANECRERAQRADHYMKGYLLELALQLDEEAAEMEAKERRKRRE